MCKDGILTKSSACQNCGHGKDDCVRTYVTTIAGASVVPLLEDIMDAEEAGVAHRVSIDRDAEVKCPPEQALSLKPACEGSNHSSRDNAVWSEASRVVTKLRASDRRLR